MLPSTTEVPSTDSLPTIQPVSAPLEGVPGGMLGEFVVQSEIGRGSFGRVYLCRQPSLDRLVAVKAAPSGKQVSTEGVALAGLEHDHIVKVYSDFIDPVTKWHCLCLQYVPGADLAAVIRELHAHGAPLTGRDFLKALDTVSRGESGFNPEALRDREMLARDDFFQAVCRLGERMADALAFAHARGVLHCDVKPANILVTPYGRPMLADFNVSFDRNRDAGAGLGGTIAYMAQEQRAALLGEDIALDGRCDVYSLGVVLHELATGERPKTDAPVDALEAVPRELASVIRKCLAHDPLDRYASASALAAALAGTRYLLDVRRALPPAGRLVRFAQARPVVALAVAGLLPHVFASILNIAYNTVNIHLEGEQKHAFESLIIAYNVLAYPVCALILLSLLNAMQVRLSELPRLRADEVDDVRRRVRRFGGWAIGLGAIGWLPGILVFPAGIDAQAGPIASSVYAHFAVSFMLSGLVGIVFSYLAIEWVVFRTLLPRLGNPDANPAVHMAEEVRPLTAPFGPFLVLACVVPLTGAVLLVALSEDAMTLGFRLLVALLIGLGALGVGLAEQLTRQLARFAGIWAVSANAERRFDSADFAFRDAPLR